MGQSLAQVYLHMFSLSKRICGNNYYAPCRAMRLGDVPGDRVETLSCSLYSLWEWTTLWLSYVFGEKELIC
jgi:hypothetical protein